MVIFLFGMIIRELKLMVNNISILKNITILYAEDEDALRDITLNILKGFTKKQYIAKDGLEGLKLFEQYQDQIDLIITCQVSQRCTIPFKAIA